MIDTKRNLIKVKALMFLRMRSKAGNPWANARTVARATESSRDSLYILLAKWWRWHLLDRMDPNLAAPDWIVRKPYVYRITATGLRYLANLDKWYADEDTIRELATEVATASQMVFWWVDKKHNALDTLYYLTAPFQTAEDFVKSAIPRVGWKPTRLISVKCEDVVEAYNGLFMDYGLLRGHEMGQAIVDAKIGMVWAEDKK